MKPRDCWSILVQKAQGDVSLARDRSLAAKKQLLEAQANQQRILDMIVEYTARQTDVEQRGHRVRDSLNSRAFLAQLQTIADRLAKEEKSAAQAMQAAQKALIAAEHEAQKMQTLLDQDLAQVQRIQNQREQKSIDEQTLIRHQWQAKANSAGS